MKNPPKPDFLSPEEYELLEDYYENYEDYSTPEDYDSTENLIIHESIQWNANLQAISILLNLIHFLILTRKQLRSNAIYIYMMAICLFDILNFGLCVYDISIQYVDSEVPRRIIKEEEKCPPQPKTELEQHILVVPMKIEDWFANQFYIVETILKFIPPVLYPILTIGLVIQLRIYKKKRQKSVTSVQKDNTTKLVLLMTISFMLSEGLSGLYAILRFTQIYWIRWNRQVDWSLYLVVASYLLDILRTINALSHPITCFLLSAQYRDTVKGMTCCCKRRNENNMSSAAAVFRRSSKKSTSMGAVTN
uniref:G_PROTEIN_RECEP_F1_2 domain-containing protein n=1 Tax=Caenorhabditis tropicalis TaxID=1561998 RepID=A0A1I7UEJ1_9PELO